MFEHPARLQPHRLAHLVPAMHPAEYADLRADIAARGVQVPLDIAGRTVLDGRHRLAIAKELSLSRVPCRPIFLQGEHPAEYMLKMALLRRHLTDDQRAAMAALWKKHSARTVGRPKTNSHDGVEISGKLPAEGAA